VNTPFDIDKITIEVQEKLYKGNSEKLIKKAHRDLTKFGNKKISKNNKFYSNILEIGSGSGELFEHVDKNFNKYYMTDISEWGKSKIEELAKEDSRIKFEIQDIEKLKFSGHTFDRVLVSCVLAHVKEPYQALEELRRVTKKNGIISIYLSTDPSLLLRLIRRILIKNKMKGLPIPYDLCNSVLHRNNPKAVIDMVRWIYQYDEIKIDYYPFKMKSWNLSTHIIVNINKKTD
jgi:ubiquinone/menaquinone biosynthesis C-methylase UbiE